VKFCRIVTAVLILGSVFLPPQPLAQVSVADYARAEQALPWNLESLILNARVMPQWIEGSRRFYYSRTTSDNGTQFLLVNPDSGSREPAFDQKRLADALSRTTGTAVAAEKLPFGRFDFTPDGKAILFEVGDSRWKCSLGEYTCEKLGKAADVVPTDVESPDGKWLAYVKDYNLFVRPRAGGKPIQLTSDGAKDYGYGTQPGSNTFPISAQLLGPKHPVAAAYSRAGVVWSPDSKRLISYRLDQRNVPETYLVQSVPPAGGLRPVLYTYRLPFPGDREIATVKLEIFNISDRTRVTPKFPPQPAPFRTPLDFNLVWWDKSGQKIFLLEMDRWWKTFTLRVADARTGASRVILEERGQTYLEPGPEWDSSPPHVIGDGKEVIWFSERDGWGHLYLYDATTGALKNRITSGPWLVCSVLRVDEANRWVYFLGSGREPGEDPYYRHLYRAKLDGSRIELLTPENANHEVDLSRDGHFFVDNYSRADQAPVSVLRSSDGKLVLELERADISKLSARGWRYPEQFSTKAADGMTDIYGLIYKPSNFNPSLRYPVIDSIYPGPQMVRTPKSFPEVAMDRGQTQALAELGFILVVVDGRGTPNRSKAIHDYAYGKLGTAGGLEDHVAAIRSLAHNRPFMDISRVGIYGHSGGGFASLRAVLAYPDFYKVAVSSAGNHDQRTYLPMWGEKYEGPLQGDNYLEATNSLLAANLKGKLLLAWGEMDDNVPPAQELQMVDALIKANKNFDMLVLPNRNHGFYRDPYFIRRLWDYFVEHLLGERPPEYKITSVAPSYRTLEAVAESKPAKK
jgi:dipeptidyl-peptidase 4